MADITTHWDVVVVGGGPAGSAAAALLAEQGWRTLIVEKARHPRFHVGESLMPLSLPVLQRLGVAEAVDDLGQIKNGAEFISPWHSHQQRFYFEDALDKRYPAAYQVKRSEFDELLFRNAEWRGAETWEEHEITEIDLEADNAVRLSVRAPQDTRIELTARQVIDATGRDALLARRQLGVERNKRHNSAAIFSHFQGAVLDEGRDRGNIRLYWFDYGWMWFIPFRDGSVSVGAVCWPEYLRRRRGDLNGFLWATIAAVPELAQRLHDAHMVRATQATGNYSYRAKRLLGERWALTGDAYAFIDPVFSSGVHLALQSATMAAELVDARLRGERLRAKWLAWRYERRLTRTLRLFSWFIYRVNQPAMRRLFMTPRNYLRMQEAVTSLLAGDLFGGTRLRAPLAAFQGMYYLFFIADLRRNRDAAQRRMQGMFAPPSGERRTRLEECS